MKDLKYIGEVFRAKLRSTTDLGQMNFPEELLKEEETFFASRIENIRRIHDEDLESFKNKSEEYFGRLHNALDERKLVLERRLRRRRRRNRGLAVKRIEEFEQFSSKKSTEVECSICLYKTKVGKKVLRVDCPGNHLFCKKCICSWFLDNKTCPICRHKF